MITNESNVLNTNIFKEFKVDTELKCVESKSNRWVSANTNSFYYDINEII